MKKPKLLIIDDEESIRRILTMNLSPLFELAEAGTAAEGFARLASFDPNLIILDLGLPDKNGLDVLKEIRGWSRVPILILTVSDDEESKVRLLESGADDYITKPFGIPELMARIRVALRHQKEDGTASPIFESGELRVDLNQRQVTKAGQSVHLSLTEFNLLKALIKGRGQVLPQDQLLNEIWSDNAGRNPHYLRIYVGQLRKKLEREASAPEHILTEPGVGYRIV